MQRSLLIFVGLLLLLAAPLRAADDCSPAVFERAAADAKQIQKQLMAVKVGEMDPTVSGPVQERIRAFKDALVSTVDHVVGCQRSAAADPRDLTATLSSLLIPAEKSVPRGPASSEDYDHFGANLKVGAKISGDAPYLLGIETSFGIPCGEDKMLLLYQREGQRWRERLRWQSGDYDSIGDAFGDFFTWVILPGKGEANWKLAVAHGHPWCTSRWSAFDLDFVKPGAFPEKPEIIFQKRWGYMRQFESTRDIPVLRRIPGNEAPDSIEIRVTGSNLDDALTTKRIVYRYQIAPGRIRRVQPVAMNGRDFVDEWLQVPWAEASEWSDPSSAASLQKEHEALARLLDYKQTPHPPSINYGAVRGCSGEAMKFQVEVLLDPGEPYYFAIRQGKNSFLMLSAARQPDPLCKGPDLMKKSE